MTQPTPNTRARQKITPEQQETFFDGLRDGHTVSYAAHAAGIKWRQTVYALRERDDDFAAAWREANEEGIQRLEEEARKLAVEGTEVHIYDRKGNLLRVEHRQSERLLEFLLKSKRPTVYREHAKVELTGANDGPIEVANVEADQLVAKLAQSLDRRAEAPAANGHSNGHQQP